MRRCKYTIKRHYKFDEYGNMVAPEVWNKMNYQQQMDMYKSSKGYVLDTYDGLFHQFGSAYEEFENGAGNYTIAIIEDKDGKIITVDPECIQFIDKPNSQPPTVNVTTDSAIEIVYDAVMGLRRAGVNI